MSESNRNFTRDEAPRSGDRSAVAAEVDRLLRELKKNPDQSSYALLAELRRKHKDEKIVDAIYDNYTSKLDNIRKRARKFKERIVAKYGPMQLSADDLLKKGKKYANKYKLTSDEYQMFVNYIISDKASVSAMNHVPNTPFAKMLGYSHVTASSEKLSVKDTELDTVNEIIRLYHETKSLHSQVVLQTMQYQDCAVEALAGVIEKGGFAAGKQNLYSFIHPVIVALFVPKVKLLDEHMLMSNMGAIVKAKHEGKQIVTKPDFELYWDLITDPTAHVCNNDSPIKDLHRRFLLQTKVWDNVLNLRQGKYYGDRLADFMVAIENCQSEYFDAPDLTYVKDEGTVLRRLLSAFAIRPTMVSTSRLYNVVSGSNYGSSQNPLSAAGITQLTTIPMVNLRLPYKLGGATQPISLDQSLVQPQWFIEHKTIVPKSQSILHSRDVIFFYINRRFQTINLSRTNMPYNFSTLPMTISGWERLNDTPVTFNSNMQVYNDNYTLRSVVTLDVASSSNMIVGCSACIVACLNVPGTTLNGTQTAHILYDPLGSTSLAGIGAGGAVDRYKPFTRIPEYPAAADDCDSFTERAQKTGTIFMYVKDRNFEECDDDLIRF